MLYIPAGSGKSGESASDEPRHLHMGHAITPMLVRFESLPIPEGIMTQAQLLDAYYIPTRYPDGFAEGKPADYFNRRKATEAVDAAAEIIRFCQDNIAE